MKSKTAYLIDHANMLHRFKHTFSFARATVNGVSLDTSTLFGYARSLKSNFYDDIFICLDGVPERFTTLLHGYKGQRAFDPTEELSVSFIESVQFLTKIGERINKNVTVVASPGQEADQVISSLVHLNAGKAPSNPLFYTKLAHNMNLTLNSDRRLRRLSNGCEIKIRDYDFDTSVIASTDSDMYQLLKWDKVHIDASTIGRKLLPRDKTPDMVKNIPPACIPAYKMILGDSSDNVPPLPIDINPDVIVKLIKLGLYNDEKVDEFITQMKNYVGNPAVLSKDLSVALLQKEILRVKGLDAMLANKEVTKLVYNSTPFELHYPEYNIQDTIDRYKIRL